MVSRVLIFLAIVLMVKTCQGRHNDNLFREYYERLMNEKRDRSNNENETAKSPVDSSATEKARSKRDDMTTNISDYFPISDQEFLQDFTFTRNGVWTCYCKSN